MKKKNTKALRLQKITLLVLAGERQAQLKGGATLGCTKKQTICTPCPVNTTPFLCG
jgi:hypothetical protein